MALKTRPFDSAEYLRTPEAVTSYLDFAFEDHNPERIEQARAVIERAQALHGFQVFDERLDRSVVGKVGEEKTVLSSIRPEDVAALRQILERVRGLPGWSDRTDGLILEDPNGEQVEVVKHEGDREGVVVYLAQASGC